VANFRKEILRQTYSRIANLQEQVQLTYWSEHHLVPQDLLDILPFGRLFSAQRFYHYIDYQLVDILNAAQRCTAYWSLSGAHNFDQSPATQISLFYNETFLWHYFVPLVRPEIIMQIQAGHRIRFLSRFFMSEAKVEVEFNEIRLQTVPSGDFTSTGLYQFIYSDERILTYRWNNHAWTTDLLTPHTGLIDPLPILPSPSPSQIPREETPNTWNISSVSSWNQIFSCSIHPIMTAWTVHYPPLWLVPLNPVPQAHLSRYIGMPERSPFRTTTQIFVSAESTFVVAIAVNPEPHPPHLESTSGTPDSSEQDL